MRGTRERVRGGGRCLKRGSHFGCLCCNCARPEVPAVVNLTTTALWLVMLYSLVDGHQYFHPAGKGGMFATLVPPYRTTHCHISGDFCEV